MLACGADKIDVRNCTFMRPQIPRKPPPNSTDLKAQKISKEEAWKRIDLLEQAKEAKDRYPTNQDSIGIELVGAPVQNAYLAPPLVQNDAAQWLLHELLDTFLLRIDRVYAHGFISPHKNQTEAGLFNYFPHN